MDKLRHRYSTGWHNKAQVPLQSEDLNSTENEVITRKATIFFTSTLRKQTESAKFVLLINEKLCRKFFALEKLLTTFKKAASGFKINLEKAEKQSKSIQKEKNCPSLQTSYPKQERKALFTKQISCFIHLRIYINRFAMLLVQKCFSVLEINCLQRTVAF